MSNHKVKDASGRDWMIGYDNPYKGFYAMRWNDQPEPECDEACAHWAEFDCSLDCPHLKWREYDVSIGFGETISLEEVKEKCLKAGFDISPHEAQLLEDRREEERPLTPLF
jgi:hypothetical protein